MYARPGIPEKSVVAGPSRGPAIRLIIAFPDGRVEERLLSAGTYLIGRESADIVVNDPGVAHWHAQLNVQAGWVLISDLGSGDGIFDHAGNRLSAPQHLAPSRTLRLGGCTLSWLQAGEPAR
ncbi:MAG TPA: FHA domain-containing protein [Polyangiaceae bacterium]|nr:FHA domain-containing protein [Polyangiaceae bacterium]